MAILTDDLRKKFGWSKGKIFSAYFKKCEVCGKEFKTVPSSSKQHCCSRKCFAIRKSNLKKRYVCLICGKDIYDQKKHSVGRKYCSTDCKIAALAELKRKRFDGQRIFGMWRNYRNLKAYLFDKYGRCEVCGWDKDTNILVIHHKNRDRKDNREENVLLLCPNCHATEHYNAKDGQYKNNLGK